MTATNAAMHVIFDMVTAYDDDATPETNERAARTAFARLNEVDAVTVTRDDGADTVTLNVSPLLTAVGTTIDTLVRQLAYRLDKDRESVIATVREHLDRVLSDGE